MQYKDVYRFWAVLSYNDDGISVSFPDLPGCFTCGKEDQEAIRNAKEALALHLYGMEQDHEEIPSPSSLHDLIEPVQKAGNQALVDVEVLMIPFRSQMVNKAVKKTLTIPQWLNDMADDKNINFSQVLQDALKQVLRISEN